MNDFEINILNFIQDTFACPFLDKVMPIITLFGDKGIFWIAPPLLQTVQDFSFRLPAKRVL